MMFEEIKATQNCFPLYVPLARTIGVKEAVFVSFIVWKIWNPEDWIELHRDEIMFRTGLSHEEQRGIRKRLKETGVIEERIDRLKHKTFYRVSMERIQALSPERENNARGTPAGNELSSSVETHTPECRKSRSSNTKTVPKTDNTKSPDAGASAPIEAPKKKREKAENGEEHRAFIESWHDTYEMQFGVPYVMQGGADGKAVKELLARTKHDAAGLMKVVRAAWKQRGKDFWTCENKSRTIREFASNWNKIVLELRKISVDGVSIESIVNPKSPPAGLKPFSEQPPPGFDEKMNPISHAQWLRDYPLKNYYDERTLDPLG